MTEIDRVRSSVEKLFYVLTFVLYPFAIYFGLQYFEPRLLYVLLGGLIGARFLLSARYVDTEQIRRIVVPAGTVLAVFLAGGLLNDELFFLLMPGIISGVLAGFFLRSLYAPPSMVESFALMTISDMTDETRRYCWWVTLVWSVFLLFNSAVVAYLTFFSSMALWTLYTGVIAYVLMGLLFAVEFGFRVWTFRQYRGYWFDPFLRSLFPPRGNVKPTYIPLHKIIVQSRRSNFPVSSGANGTLTWQTFADRVSGLSEEIAEHASEDPSASGRWMVTCDSTFAFCTGLLAAWQADVVAVLPPNAQRESLDSILEDGVDGLLTDLSDPPVDRDLPVLDPTAAGEGAHDFRILDRDVPRVELFTSGSTGQRTSVQKSLANLEEEIRTLEEQWREWLDDGAIVSTASHQHIYGLLFHALWPLSAGRTFHETTTVFPNEIADAVRSVSEQQVVLVSTPAHLSRLVKFDDVGEIAGDVRVVFSSGGVLPADTAEALRDTFGHAPIEVFGSTETGGIGWRVRDGRDPLWTPFEPVQTDVDDTLLVKSPFVNRQVTDQDGWFRTGDRCTLHEDGFAFRGRADREVNIADKRVSLEEIEELLKDQEYVRNVRATAVERSSFETDRTVVAAAVTLSGEGAELMEEKGKKRVNEKLRGELTDHLDPATVPKLWRYVDSLPRDERGKVTERGVRALFEHSEKRDEQP